MDDQGTTTPPKKRKPRGKPRANALSMEEDVAVMVRLPRSQADQLDEIAKKEGLSRTGAVRKAVDVALQSDARLVPQDDLLEILNEKICDLFQSGEFQNLINETIGAALKGQLLVIRRDLAATNKKIDLLYNHTKNL